MTKTLFCIHGMWANASAWDNYKKIFEKNGFQCITPTLRHHDTTQPPKALGKTGVLDYIDDLKKEINKLSEKPIIIGYSMGGLLAQILASQNLAEKVILINPTAPKDIFALSPSIINIFWNFVLIGGFIPRWGFWYKPFRISLSKFQYGVANLLPEQQQRELHQTMVYESGWAITQIALSLPATHVDTIDCPILITSSSYDRITPEKIIAKIAKKYQNVTTYKNFDNHAHWMLGEEGWEKIAEFIVDWINK